MIRDDIMEYQYLYDELIEKIKKYHPSNDFSMVEKAYLLAVKAHGNQRRKSGEPYIIHPLSVAVILAELELDMESIVAGVLHDVVEDTKYSCDDITAMFNEEVTLLVDGVTKLEKIEYSSKEEMQAENYRKMFLAMGKDIRVILIKIADRLHNMRTLKYMTLEKQKEKAQETLDIYAPLANRLGISKIKTELEDLSLRYLEPEAYYDLADKIKRKQSEREAYVQSIIDELNEKCSDAGIDCEISGRPKHFFSIYKKMQNQNKTLDQIYDLFAVRVIVDTVRDCYGVLGIVHEMYTPIPNRFKDYIAMPKANRYQSLHNTLIGPEGEPFEVQIRTWEMHRIAEYGIAAHWKYKEGKTGISKDDAEEAKMSWLRQILEWQREMSDNKEFMDTIKNDFDAFRDNVYCFSPSGEVKSLPRGSTPIDFAYSIHSAVGNTMISARANGKIVTFDYEIQDGDRIEILTSQNSRGPSMDWLKFVKSSQAKSKINQWFKKVNKEENIVRGKELIEKEAKKKGISLSELLTADRMRSLLERYGFRDWNSICAAVGHGGLKEGQILNRLIEEYKSENRKKNSLEDILKQVMQNSDNINISEIRDNKSKSEIIIEGVGDIPVRYSRCCNPVPGDEVVGFITRGRGVSIHRTDCINIINLSEDERHRIMDARWNLSADKNDRKSFAAEIRVRGNNRTGIFADISQVVSKEELPIRSINGRTVKNEAIIDIIVSINDKNELETLFKKLYNISGVNDIERVTT